MSIVIRGVLFGAEYEGKKIWSDNGVALPAIHLMRCIDKTMRGGHLKLGRVVFSIVWMARA